MNRKEHLLTIAAEECAETAHRISKALRFTLHETEPGQQYTNAERIMHEFLDIQAVFEMLDADGHLQLPADSEARIERKKLAVKKHLQLSRTLGTL